MRHKQLPQSDRGFHQHKVFSFIVLSTQIFMQKWSAKVEQDYNRNRETNAAISTEEEACQDNR